MVKKKVKEALSLAKKLEKIPEPKDKDIVRIYKEAKESVKRLQKILTSDLQNRKGSSQQKQPTRKMR
ncbi:MAG TPA: hypothetical protein ENF94_00305 [Candidatus Woesearchaeota archaeon]|nr:MAG: hypothetical protein DRJ25_05135 [Candidatus Woesearchaeota archaeon]HDD70580.1 hypothetical protein [Candidatus Woesearchaeota archaeon]